MVCQLCDGLVVFRKYPFASSTMCEFRSSLSSCYSSQHGECVVDIERRLKSDFIHPQVTSE